MKIVKAEAWNVSMRLTEPYAIAYQSTDTADNIFLRLETSSGVQGFGCAAPFFEVTGETPEGVLTLLQQTIAPALVGQDAFQAGLALSTLAGPLEKSPSTRHAIAMAFLDIVAKSAGMPVWQLLGGYRKQIATSVTVGILPEKETIERCLHWTRQGFSILKLKGGLNWETDAERLAKVREAVGPQIRLRFDANQGYSEGDAIAFCRRAFEIGIECVEQPTAAEDRNALAAVSAASRIPIMADESLLSVTDALSLAQNHTCPLFNVKLTKVGGIREAEKILAIAGAGKIGVMLGCMDESALGISAAVHLAMASEVVSLADLDGHIGLIGDPFANTVRLEDGMLMPTEKPGWGY